MQYVNKSGVAAVRGVSYTGRLDEDGLPAMAWYGADVAELRMANLIRAVLDAVGFRDLDKDEQDVIVAMMCENVGGKAFQTRAVRRIVKGYLRG
jgi:hypothetical protein